jgi:hypothetical protein
MKIDIYMCNGVTYVTPLGDKRCLPNGGTECDIIWQNVELKDIHAYGKWANKTTIPIIVKTLKSGNCWNNSGTTKVESTGFKPQK